MSPETKKPGVNTWLAWWKVKGCPVEIPLRKLLTVPREAFEKTLAAHTPTNNGIPTQEVFRPNLNWPHESAIIGKFIGRPDALRGSSFAAEVEPGLSLGITQTATGAFSVWTYDERTVSRDHGTLVEPYAGLEQARGAMRAWLVKAHPALPAPEQPTNPYPAITVALQGMRRKPIR